MIQLEDGVLCEETLEFLRLMDDADRLRKSQLAGCKSQPGRHGFVYVLRNAAMPGLLKIGMTTLSVEARVKQLSRGTAMPFHFDVVASYECCDPYDAEQKIHALLHERRIHGKEFFRITDGEALAACIRVLRGGQ